ncbi:hypothetical protein OGATHE_005023 [Ogataea polymorpha]|uniref:Uncharacterized protein n=1 Tax=Ogataea polymorpha TaxID=460523 RepID=A0A9P8SZR7_9ASCO|nr:hypothetical protein OGATHE_005023 [Ogataea polymorpha]
MFTIRPLLAFLDAMALSMTGMQSLVILTKNRLLMARMDSTSSSGVSTRGTGPSCERPTLLISTDTGRSSIDLEMSAYNSGVFFEQSAATTLVCTLYFVSISVAICSSLD